ncbi:MAG: type VI secretion system tip protein VgrG [Desulfopila sp.]
MSGESTIPTPASPDVCAVAILVDGTEIPGTFHLMSIAVTRELNRIPAAVIQLRDGDAASASFPVSDSDLFVPGKEIEIRLGYRATTEPVFRGIVVRHGLKVRKNANLLVVECRDQAVKMTGAAKSRYFTEMKDSAVIEQIVDEYGLAKDVAATTVVQKELTQYNATDWDFMLCRAEANGQVVTVDDGKVTVAPPLAAGTPVVSIAYGATLLELDVEMDARLQSKTVKAASWDPAEQQRLAVEAVEPIVTENGNISPAELADAVGGDTLWLHHGGCLGEPELQSWADGRLLKERLAKVRGRARFQGFAGVAPGNIVELTGIGQRFAGEVIVAGVRHEVAAGNWRTDVQFGLDDRLFAETYNLRPLPAAGLLPAVSGLQLGVVTMLENDPDGEERIKARLPLVSDAEEGLWCRLATLDAGDGRGTFFRPEIGDEVVIGFISDDPRCPVVLGMCHSSAKPAPEPASDDNHVKGYLSREKMALIFDDEEKSVVLKTPEGNRLTLSEEDKGIVLEDQNGNTIVLGEDGITIDSASDLTLRAQGDVKIEGTNLQIQAQSGFKATATSSVEVSGASTTIEGSATTVIKGGLVQIN